MSTVTDDSILEWRHSTHPGARLVVLLGALGLFGCGSPSPPSDALHSAATISPGANDPLWLTSRGGLPAPDAERIEYDSHERLLTFHELPGGDRWMVQLPGEEDGRFVGPLHQLPEGVDTAHPGLLREAGGEGVRTDHRGTNRGRSPRIPAWS